MFKKCLHLLKIGSTNVDLVLDAYEYKSGELVTGYFEIKGGKLNQKIKRLECDLILKDTNTKKKQGIESATTILMTKTINSSEVTKIPFKYIIPTELQSTSKDFIYLFQTKIIFHDNLRDMDYDEIKICS
ncbi:sporulation protein [Bacillus massiliigorillae]|uniref:sporulation protein n=1 Tax=Bacillus massiliigorillae TaxID=1243664 RepID=UPI0003A85BDA|nr:sporulation protein [Bacillus massiliigorillae]